MLGLGGKGKEKKKLSVDPAENHHSYVTGSWPGWLARLGWMFKKSASADKGHSLFVNLRPEWVIRHLGPPHLHTPPTKPRPFSPARLSSRHKDVQRTTNLLHSTAPSFFSAAMFLVPGASVPCLGSRFFSRPAGVFFARETHIHHCKKEGRKGLSLMQLTARVDRSIRLGEGRLPRVALGFQYNTTCRSRNHAPSFSPSYEDTPLGESVFSESFFHRSHRAHRAHLC